MPKAQDRFHSTIVAEGKSDKEVVIFEALLEPTFPLRTEARYQAALRLLKNKAKVREIVLLQYSRGDRNSPDYGFRLTRQRTGSTVQLSPTSVSTVCRRIGAAVRNYEAKRNALAV